MSDSIILRHVRVNWLWLKNAKEMTSPETGKVTGHRFEATCIVEPDSENHKAIKAAMLAAAEAKWGADGEKIFEKLVKQGRVSLKDGNSCFDKKGNIRDGFENTVCFNPYRWKQEGKPNDNRPRVGNKFGQWATEDNWDVFPTTGDERLPQAGDYCDVQVRFWAQDHPAGGQRINAELGIVVFAEAGEPLGSAGGVSESDADDFLKQIGTEKKDPMDVGGLNG